MRNIGIVIFRDVEELDAVGPYEVLTSASAARDGFGNVFIVAEGPEPVICAKKMRIVPDFTFDNAPPLDVILIPGGVGTRTEARNPRMIAYVKEQAARAEWVVSICSGVRILLEAGLAVGRRVTTHWSVIDELRRDGRAAEVLEDVRFVRDGNILTSAGVSAGIDAALWLVGALEEPEFARLVQREIEYYPAPPYADEAIAPGELASGDATRTGAGSLAALPAED